MNKVTERLASGAVTSFGLGNTQFIRKSYVEAVASYVKALQSSESPTRPIVANLGLAVHRHLRASVEGKIAIVCDAAVRGSVLKAAELTDAISGTGFVEIVLIGTRDSSHPEPSSHFIVREIPAVSECSLIEFASSNHYQCVYLTTESGPAELLARLYKLIWGAKLVLHLAPTRRHNDTPCAQEKAAYFDEIFRDNASKNVQENGWCPTELAESLKENRAWLNDLTALRIEHSFLRPPYFSVRASPSAAEEKSSSSSDRSAWKAPFVGWRGQANNVSPLKASSVEEANLRTFGASFLGPVLAAFYGALAKKISLVKEPATLNFLAREGFFLQRIYNRLVDEGIVPSLPSRYLFCSRTLLFKLALARPKLWSKVVQHHYNGRLIDFFIGRFALSDSEAWQLLKNSSTFNRDPAVRVTLPADQAFVLDVLEEVRADAVALGEERLVHYSSYLDAIGFGATQEHVVDLGYAGTIQTMLSALTNVKTAGHYCVTTKKAKNSKMCTFAGYLLNGVDFGDGYPLLDRSLYLESILTAPHGSVTDVCMHDKQLAFMFGQETNAQERFSDISQVVEGATEYAVQALKLNLVMNSAELNDYYGRFVSNLTNFPVGVFDIFEIDDAISGYGVLNPLKFFHLGTSQ